MPNIKSQKDRMRLTEKQTARNKTLKSALRTQVKKARLAIETGTEDKDAVVKEATVALEKAVTKGIMHKNTASRKVSRLVKYANTAPVVEAKATTKKAAKAEAVKEEPKAKAEPKKKAEPKAKKADEAKEEAAIEA